MLYVVVRFLFFKSLYKAYRLIAWVLVVVVVSKR
jgi:hypothetical protein